MTLLCFTLKSDQISVNWRSKECEIDNVFSLLQAFQKHSWSILKLTSIFTRMVSEKWHLPVDDCCFIFGEMALKRQQTQKLLILI